MSRGPGRIERAKRALFDHPTDEYGGIGVDALVRYCYPGIDPIERKHCVAVLRAAYKVIALDPAWTSARSWEAGAGRSRHPPIGYIEFFRRDNPPTWVGCNGYGLPTANSSQETALTADPPYALSATADAEVSNTYQEMTLFDLPEADRVPCLERTLKLAFDVRDSLANGAIHLTQSHTIRECLRGLHALRPEQYPPPPPELGELAALARRLITENDPDAIRAGLAEIADALDSMDSIAGHSAPNAVEAA